MYSRSVLISIGLFVLALLLGIAAAILNLFGILTGAVFVTLTATFAFVIPLAALGIAIAAASSRDSRENVFHRILCGCGRAYLRPAVISALVALVLALVTSGLVIIPIMTGCLVGLIMTFLLFAIFLLAAFIFCVFNGACHYCHCDDDDSHK